MNALGENIIFIISQPRAGSTLLQRILAGHPDIHTAAEPWIMLHPLYALKHSGYTAEYNEQWAQWALEDFCETLTGGEDTYISAVRSFALTLYGDCLSRSGKRFFLDKTPRYYLIIPELYRVFPKARYIYLLRNPLAVLSSILHDWIKTDWQKLALYRTDLLSAPQLLIDGINLTGPQSAVIRYENLVTRPEDEVKRLCSCLGISFDPGILQYTGNPAPAGRMGDDVGIHKHTRPDADNQHKWRKNIALYPRSAIAHQYLDFLGERLTGDLGYTFDELRNALPPERADAAKEPHSIKNILRLAGLNRLESPPSAKPDKAGSARPGAPHNHTIGTAAGREHTCDKDIPVIVYQMGKVGSTSIYRSLKSYVPAENLYHVHYISPANIAKAERYLSDKPEFRYQGHLETGKKLQKMLGDQLPGCKWKIISLVREPVSRRISAIFENLGHLKDIDRSHQDAAIASIQEKLCEEFRTFSDTADRAGTWFDTELRDMFGLDVYSIPFPKKQGYHIYETPKADILIVRLEDLDRCHKEAFSRFLGIPHFELLKANVGNDKNYRALYDRVKNEIAIPDEYLDTIYNSRYCTHFYTDSERAGFKKRFAPNQIRSSPAIQSGAIAHAQAASDQLPTISVVTPSLNQAQYLEDCIVSVLDQGYPNLEYIIMDGGSADGSVDIIKKYEKHLTCWQSKPDGGHYAAVMEGFLHSSGEIMTWLNADDMFHPDAFTTAAAIFMSRRDVDWLTGRPNTFSRNGHQRWIHKEPLQWSQRKYLNREYNDPFIQQEGTFWRRQLWEKAGAHLNTDFSLAGDLELWTRFFRYAQLYSADALLAGYRYHQGQRAQSQMDEYLKQAERIIDRELQNEHSPSAHPGPPPPITAAEINGFKQALGQCHNAHGKIADNSAARGPAFVSGTGSAPRIDIVLQATGVHGWNISGGFESAAKKAGVFHRTFAPRGTWGAREPDHDDGLFAYLENPQADLILLLNMNWSSQMLHVSEKWRERWLSTSIAKALYIHESIEDNCCILGSDDMKDMTRSAASCADIVVYNDLTDRAFLESIHHCARWQPFGVDDTLFTAAAPFSERKNRAFFRGKTTPFGTGRTYRRRRQLLSFIQKNDLADLLEFDDKPVSPRQIVNDFNAYRIALNLPTLGHNFPSRVYEALACGCCLLTNLTGVPENDALFEHKKHLLYYRDEQELKEAVSLLTSDSAYAAAVAERGREHTIENLTLDRHIRRILTWSQDTPERGAETAAISTSDSAAPVCADAHLSSAPTNPDAEITSAEAAAPAPGPILIDGVIFQLQKDRPAGISRVWSSLLQELCKCPLAKDIILLDRSGTAPSFDGLETRRIHSFDMNRLQRDTAMLEDICRREQACLFLSTYYTAPETAPLLLMLHDMTPEVLGWDMTIPEWAAKKKAIEKAYAYITVSETTKQDFLRLYPGHAHKPVTVVPNAVSDIFRRHTEKEIGAFKRRYGITKPYFMITGHRWPQKNVRLFFSAFAELTGRERFELLIAGGAPELENDLKPLTGGTAYHVLFLSDEELSAAYSGAAALAYPSLYEGFGLPMLEAMKSGCPVITCKNAALPEVAGDAALYVSDSDTGDMIRALEQVQKADVRNRLVAKGIERAHRFSWKQSTQKLIGCIAEMLGGSNFSAAQAAPRVDSPCVEPAGGYLVTAIVSTYNAERFMEGRIDDLERQTIADRLEIIVVDSGSEQNEKRIVEAFQKRYSNITYIRTPARESLYRSWNRAIKRARGTYITNANTDDRLRPDALEIMSRALDSQPDIDIVYADQLITPVPNQTFETATPSDRFTWPDFEIERLRIRCCVGPQPMWRRSIHETLNLLFDEQFEIAGDYDFWLRAAHRCRFKKIPDVLGLYYRSKHKENKEFQDPAKTDLETYRAQRREYVSAMGGTAKQLLQEKLKQVSAGIEHLTRSMPPEPLSYDMKKHLEYLFWQSCVLLELLGEKERSRTFAGKFLEFMHDSYRLRLHVQEIDRPGMLNTADAALSSAEQCVPEPSSSARGPSSCKMSVVIATYNRAPTLQTCLDALAKQTMPAHEFEVIICDDGSTDDTEHMVAGRQLPFKCVFLRQQNLGPAAARNKGIRAAGGDYILFLDDDCFPEPESVERHYHALQSAGSPCAVLGSIRTLPEYVQSVFAAVADNSDLLLACPLMEDGHLYDYNSFFAGNISIARQALIDAGLFDEDFTGSIWAAEDIELGYRLYQQGFSVFYSSSCSAWHAQALSPDGFYDKYIKRGGGGVRTFAKHPDLPHHYRDITREDVSRWKRDTEALTPLVETLKKEIRRAHELPFCTESIPDQPFSESRSFIQYKQQWILDEHERAAIIKRLAASAREANDRLSTGTISTELFRAEGRKLYEAINFLKWHYDTCGITSSPWLERYLAARRRDEPPEKRQYYDRPGIDPADELTARKMREGNLSFTALTNLGSIMLSRQAAHSPHPARVKSAVSCIKRAFEIRPYNPDIVNILTKILNSSSADGWKKQLKACRDYIGMCAHSNGFKKKAYHFADKHDYDKAFFCFSEESLKNPADIESVFEACDLCVRMGRIDKAEALLSKHVNGKSDHPFRFLVLKKQGEWAYLHGDYEKAEHFLRMSLEEHCTTAALNIYAECLVRLGRKQKALECWSRSLCIDDTQMPLCYKLHKCIYHSTHRKRSVHDSSIVIAVTFRRSADAAERFMDMLSRTDTGNARLYILNGTGLPLQEMQRRAGSYFPGNDIIVDTAPEPIHNTGVCEWLLSRPNISASEYTAFVDEAVTLPADWLQILIDTLDTYPQAALAGGKVLFSQRPHVFYYTYRFIDAVCDRTIGLSHLHRHEPDLGQFDYVRTCASVHSSCFMVRNSTAQKQQAFLDPEHIHSPSGDLVLPAAGRETIYNGSLAVLYDDTKPVPTVKAAQQESTGPPMGTAFPQTMLSVKKFTETCDKKALNTIINLLHRDGYIKAVPGSMESML